MAEFATVATAVGVLKLLPEVVGVSKDILKKLKLPEELARRRGKDGISGATYYSGKHKFAISVPDDNWQFWKPSPSFVASLGPLFAMPTCDIPIMILSKQVIQLFRPYVIVTVEDVGSFISIDDMACLLKDILEKQDWQIDQTDIHVSENTNSAVLIMSRPHLRLPMYQVQCIYLHTSRMFSITAAYVPTSKESPTLFGGLQEIMNSFQLIR